MWTELSTQQGAFVTDPWSPRLKRATEPQPQCEHRHDWWPTLQCVLPEDHASTLHLHDPRNPGASPT